MKNSKTLVTDCEIYNNLKKDLDIINISFDRLKSLTRDYTFFVTDRVKKIVYAANDVYKHKREVKKYIKIIENEECYKSVLSVWLLLYNEKFLNCKFVYKGICNVETDTVATTYSVASDTAITTYTSRTTDNDMRLNIYVKGIGIPHERIHKLTWTYIVDEEDKNRISLPDFISSNTTICYHEKANTFNDGSGDIKLSQTIPKLNNPIPYRVLDILKGQVIDSLKSLSSDKEIIMK